MAMTLKCRVCGSVIPRRYPVFLLTWLLALITIIMMIIIPSLIGFATVTGGAAVIIGVFVGMLALYLFLRAEDTCDACRVTKEK